MGLTAAFKGVDPSGVARFDASSMVAWREKQTLERMKLEEMQRARVCVCVCVGAFRLRAFYARYPTSIVCIFSNVCAFSSLHHLSRQIARLMLELAQESYSSFK